MRVTDAHTADPSLAFRAIKIWIESELPQSKRTPLDTASGSVEEQSAAMGVTVAGRCCCGR